MIKSSKIRIDSEIKIKIIRNNSKINTIIDLIEFNLIYKENVVKHYEDINDLQSIIKILFLYFTEVFYDNIELCDLEIINPKIKINIESENIEEYNDQTRLETEREFWTEAFSNLFLEILNDLKDFLMQKMEYASDDFNNVSSKVLGLIKELDNFNLN